MAEQPAPPAPHPASPAAARAALHQLVDRMTDEEATALWRLVCSWVAEGHDDHQARMARLWDQEA
jgi:hypothetical protein